MPVGRSILTKRSWTTNNALLTMHSVSATCRAMSALVALCRLKPVTIDNADGINLTAYCVGAAGEDYVTIINKTYGAWAADADVTIVPPGPGRPSAQLMTLASEPPGDATQDSATLGGAAITGDAAWNGEWDALPASQAGITLTVKPTSAAIVRIRYQR